MKAAMNQKLSIDEYDALDQVSFDQPAPHLGLLLPEEHAMREEDGTSARLWR